MGVTVYVGTGGKIGREASKGAAGGGEGSMLGDGLAGSGRGEEEDWIGIGGREVSDVE